TQSGESQMNRLRLESRAAGGCSHQLHCFRQIKINKLSTLCADRVVVTISLAVVPACGVAKRDFVNKSCLFQEPKRVVYGGVAYRRQKRASLLKDLACRWMMMAFVDAPKHNLPLSG